MKSHLFPGLCFSYRTCHHQLSAVLGARYLHLGHTDWEFTQKVRAMYNSKLQSFTESNVVVLGARQTRRDQ